MNTIRKATSEDIDAISLIFEHIIGEEEKGSCTIGWKRGIYPTRDTAVAALEQKELFVMEADGEVVAAMRLNRDQVPEYKNCRWEYPAADDRVMVMHTLVVEPSVKKCGCGKKMVEFYENYAKENNCPYLRIDTNAVNARARALYKKCGYKEIGITPCTFNGISGVDLVCIEKKLDV
ncbi:GNAT family N-acetyltransferase [Aminipila luticellarii]|uniref:GNAT family N-acetyltransferase n=1 Tax=Aminipila luticellarii TaxID=2507160 RepID=A0A410PXT5_9FIRM|nr:GNAT family N-acetyltransferase [Aminipila luticellarii]QAT43792.1 GNAT family N-acetyltransferase [Aminipila luticellarii]